MLAGAQPGPPEQWRVAAFRAPGVFQAVLLRLYCTLEVTLAALPRCVVLVLVYWGIESEWAACRCLHFLRRPRRDHPRHPTLERMLLARRPLCYSSSRLSPRHKTNGRPELSINPTARKTGNLYYSVPF